MKARVQKHGLGSTSHLKAPPNDFKVAWDVAKNLYMFVSNWDRNLITKWKVQVFSRKLKSRIEDYATEDLILDRAFMKDT